LFEGDGDDVLDAILADVLDQAIAFGGSLQDIDGVVQGELAADPEQGAGLAALCEDFDFEIVREDFAV